MGRKGFTAQVIADATGLTLYQVRYRLKVLGIRVNDYRRGTSPEAKNILASIDRSFGHIEAIKELMARFWASKDREKRRGAL